MSHQVLRLTNSLFSEPLLMTQSSCEEVMNYLDKRNSASLKELSDISASALEGLSLDRLKASGVDGVGTIEVSGPISTYKTGYEALCQNTSYESIIEQAEELASDPDVHTVILRLRSGGGASHKAFEQSEQLKSIIEDSGKRLVSYVDQSACSAALILASVASEVIINPTASIGSLGVLIQLDNTHRMEKEAGIDRTYILSSDGKIPFDSEGNFREGFLQDLQEGVDSLYSDFIDHIYKFRGIDKQVARDTNGAVYSAKKGVKLGFADKIMTTNQFHKYIAGNSVNKPLTKESQMSIKDTPQAEMAEATLATPEMLAELASLKEQLSEAATLKEQLASYQAKEALATKTALTASLSKYEFAASMSEELTSFMLTADESNTILMNNVLESANAQCASITAKAEADMTATVEAHATALKEATVAKETAEASASLTKEQFGEKEESLKGELKTEALSREDALASFVAKNKKS